MLMPHKMSDFILFLLQKSAQALYKRIGKAENAVCNDYLSCFYQLGRSEISRLSEKNIK